MPGKNKTGKHKTASQHPPDAGRLSLRAREILKDIIRTHILTGEPVSSRTVSKHTEHQISAATIRNEMADLEELGYLEQPHTSAGRVPTQAAYRLYVENLMEASSLTTQERRYIESNLHKAAHDTDALMKVVTHLLSELTEQVGIVLIPSVEKTVIRTVDFVPLGHGRVLCVVVSTSGFVDNIVIEVHEEISRSDLVRISNYLTQTFAGHRLRQVRDRLLSLMAEERAHVDQWLSQAMDLAKRAMVRSQTQEVLLEGTTALLGKPELSSIANVRRVFDTFADKARLVDMLNTCLVSDGVRVYMGEDNEVTSELDFSLVATTYGIGHRSLGSLGILGPARMEYPRIVPLVRYLGETLSRALDAGQEE